MNKKKELSLISFATAIMCGVYWSFSIIILPRLNLNFLCQRILGILVLLTLGLFLFKKIISKIQNTNIKKRNVSKKTVLLCFLLAFTANIITSVIANILYSLIGKEIEITNWLTPINLVVNIIIAPIFEEFVFRKLFADKLLKYGELFYILVSSFCFSIVHGGLRGVTEVIYTYIMGVIWSYLFVKTGSIKTSIILHSLSNLFLEIIVQFLLGVSMKAAGIYSMFIIFLAIIGLICFLKNKKKIEIDGKNKLFDKKIIKEILINKGFVFLCSITFLMYIIRIIF